MKRIATLACLLAAAVLAESAGVASADEYGTSLCQQKPFLCLDPHHSIGANGTYTGHDEPTTQFISNRHGTGGRDLTYVIRLPRNPVQQPKQDGSGPTWDFQLRATFWFGIAMCDPESAPEFTKSCTPNSDFNARFRRKNPNSPFYIGRSPGNAFMELQFYGPGWVPQFDGFGCSATKWCANMTIDSLSEDQNNASNVQNADCLNNHSLVGPEPINWAYLTKDGRSQGPANPLDASDNPTVLNPDLNKDLLMDPGDTLVMHMHDTPAGYRVDISDLTNGQHGSMTASIANGFGHVLFQPNAETCHVAPFAFHPMFDSAVPRGTTWAAHTTNVGASDEIGHFELCDAIDPATATCTDPGANDATLDEDDFGCLDGATEPGTLVPLKGCVGDDGDFDGPSYRFDWPGTLRDPFLDRQLHPTPIQFTLPSSNGRTLDRFAFENDLPRIERGDEPANQEPFCDAATGANCFNPPHGAQFYPIYTATRGVAGLCMLQQGGPFIPGTVNDFGGNSAAEYGTNVQFNLYPDDGFQPVFKAQDFHRDIGRSENACGRR
jgi:hypothetical protein